MHRRNRHEDEEAIGLIVDLETVKDSAMTVDELRDIARRNKRYNLFRTRSKLSPEGWAYALCISLERENAYSSCHERVPNQIMNRAYTIQMRIRRVVNNLRKGYE